MTAGKTEVAAKVAELLRVDRKAAMGFVSVVLDAQMKTLAEHGELTMRGFGTFRVKEVAESRARNPATGGSVVGAAAQASPVQGGQGVSRYRCRTALSIRRGRARAVGSG